nr:MAG TPA: hypothetical protein [Caudoviricetes sp.]
MSPPRVRWQVCKVAHLTHTARKFNSVIGVCPFERVAPACAVAGV